MASKNWIQGATRSIKRRGTEGVCTGSKFGSSSCPPGSKRYNLAKTFRKMAKKQEGGDINYANTPEEKQMGILMGKNGFKFNNKGPHRMTMTPRGIPVPMPLMYQGYSNGRLVDQGVAVPGRDFTVRGNEVREYPIYQYGSFMTQVYPDGYPVDIENQMILRGETQVPESNFEYMKNIKDPINSLQLPINRQNYSVRSSDYRPLTSGNNTPQGDQDDYGIIEANREAQPGNNTPTGVNYDNIFGKVGDGIKKAYEVDPYKIGMTDVPLASTIYNLSQALHKIKEKPYYNQEAQEALAGMRNMRYTPNYYGLQTMGNRAMQAARTSAGSVPGMLANLVNISTNVGNQMTNEAYRAAQANNEYRSRYLNALYGEGAQRAGERKYAMDRNLQHSARQRQHWAALAQGADSLMKQRRGLTQAQIQDEMSAEGINASTPDYHVRYNPATKRMERYWKNPQTNQWVKIERNLG